MATRITGKNAKVMIGVVEIADAYDWTAEITREVFEATAFQDTDVQRVEGVVDCRFSASRYDTASGAAILAYANTGGEVTIIGYADEGGAVVFQAAMLITRGAFNCPRSHVTESMEAVGSGGGITTPA
jgi:hypothetical protein